MSNTVILPNIETPRLYLRQISLEDIDAVFEYATNPLVGPNAGWKPHISKIETKSFIEYAIKKRTFGQPGIHAIILKETKKMIGTIEIHSFQGHKGEIGFVLNPSYWGKGYIVEAAQAEIVYAFEILDLKRLQYGYFTFNQRSKRVSEKLGFIYEGILRKKYMSYDNIPLDEAICSLTDEDYQNLEWKNSVKNSIKIDY